MTRSEAAKLLGVSRQRISILVLSGRLKITKTGVSASSVAYYANHKKIGGRPSGSSNKKKAL